MPDIKVECRCPNGHGTMTLYQQAPDDDTDDFFECSVCGHREFVAGQRSAESFAWERKLYPGELTEQERTDEAALDALRFIADQVAGDIEGDHPDLAPIAYDLYCDRIVVRIEEWPYATSRLFGMIDMGEAWQESYVWEGGEWVEHRGPGSGSPADVRDHIISQRSERRR